MESPILLTVDFAFKLTVGNPKHKSITLHFLNSVLADGEGAPIDDVEYLNPTVGRDAATRKLSQLDIRLRDDLGRQLNVEMQTTYRSSLAQRLTYYAVRLYTGQISSDDDYELLRPSIGIWLLDQPMPPMKRQLHLEFGLRTRDGAALGDGLQVHLLQLPFQTADEHNVAEASKREQWAFFLRNAHRFTAKELARLLPDPVFQEAKGVLTMISQDTQNRIEYEWRLKQQLDENSLRAEALREGRIAGELMGRITVLEQVLKLPATPHGDLESWPLDRLAARADELTSLFARGSN